MTAIRMVPRPRTPLRDARPVLHAAVPDRAANGRALLIYAPLASLAMWTGLWLLFR